LDKYNLTVPVKVVRLPDITETLSAKLAARNSGRSVITPLTGAEEETGLVQRLIGCVG